MLNGDRKVVIGQVVNFFDEAGKLHKALVKDVTGEAETALFPCLTLVWVSGDPARCGALGPQTFTSTPVVHASDQPGPGNFWTWPGETPIESPETGEI